MTNLYKLYNIRLRNQEYYFILLLYENMNLSKTSTKAPKSANEEKIRKETEELILKMRDYQQIMYAQNKYSVLIIFQ